jgi:hypothetical protein
MTGSTIAQMIPVEEVPKEIAIIAREPEENARMPMMIAACIKEVMPQIMAMGGKKGESLRKGAAKAPAQEGGIQGQCQQCKLWQRHLHGLW